MNHNEYMKLLETVKALRDPVNGCPWDLKQNLKSLAPSILEECCECIDGINSNDLENVSEELGDIIFTATLMTYIMEQENNISVDSVISSVNNKMIRRHPHVFSNTDNINTSDEVLQQWENIKINVEGRINKGLLDKIPNSLPPLEKSYEIQKKVEKVGFDWENVSDIFEKISEETIEVKNEIDSNCPEKIEEEIGDLLFSVINLARFLNVNPSSALAKTNKKFLKRFKFIENKMQSNNLNLCKENFRTMDKFWNESKKLVD